MVTGTILIADSSEDFLLAMAEALASRYRVLTCQDGQTALTLLRQEPCGLLILDLSLPELDGLSLLEQLLLENIRLPILALTPLLNAYVQESAQRLGVLYLIRKPCHIPGLVNRAGELFRLPESQAKACVCQLLTGLGLNPGHDGYGYLVFCILSYTKNPDQAFTKELYPSAGKPTHHTGKQVERSIRNAIEKAWERRDAALWQQYFGDLPKSPAAGTMILRLSQELHRLEWEARGQTL